MRMAVRVWVVAVLCAACGARPSLPPAPRSPAHVGEISRVEIEKQLRRPIGIVKQELTIGIRDLASGRGFSGRGVVIVQPRHALRMILLGPGGTTAMDVWIRDEEFRVSIPALSRVVRGDSTTPRSTMRGMPVDLLWRLLVDPFGGLAYARSGHPDGAGEISGEGFTAWMRRGEIRARFGSSMRAWFFERGRVSGIAQGTEGVLGDSIVVRDIDYVGFDPAIEVHVNGGEPTLVESVAPAVFNDPDAG